MYGHATSTHVSLRCKSDLNPAPWSSCSARSRADCQAKGDLDSRSVPRSITLHEGGRGAQPDSTTKTSAGAMYMARQDCNAVSAERHESRDNRCNRFSPSSGAHLKPALAWPPMCSFSSWTNSYIDIMTHA